MTAIPHRIAPPIGLLEVVRKGARELLAHRRGSQAAGFHLSHS